MNVAKENILFGLNKIQDTNIPEADKKAFKDFKTAVSKASTNDELKDILSTSEGSTHRDVVLKLDNGDMGATDFKGHLTKL